MNAVTLNRSKLTRCVDDMLNDRDLGTRHVEMTTFGVTRGELYLEARAKGTPHEFAAMCALQQPGRVMTDDVFIGGIGTLDRQFRGGSNAIGNHEDLAYITKRAMAMGYTPSPNDFYHPGLVRQGIGPGDPQAFVKSRGEYAARCQMQGKGSVGGVEIKTPEPIDDPMSTGIRLGEDIIQREMQQEVAAKPGLVRQPKPKRDKALRELRENIIDKHGAKES